MYRRKSIAWVPPVKRRQPTWEISIPFRRTQQEGGLPSCCDVQSEERLNTCPDVM